MTLNKTTITKYELVLFYKDQLRKFNRIGMGNKTENGVTITPVLFGATTRRLNILRSALHQNSYISIDQYGQEEEI